MEEGLEDIIVVEDRNGSKNLSLARGNVEPGNQKVGTNEEVKNLIDNFHTPRLPNAIGTRFNADIACVGDLEASLAGENLASSLTANYVFDVRDSLAVLAVGNVVPGSLEGCNGATATYSIAFSIVMRVSRTESLTTLDIGVGINTVNTFSTVGDATESLASGANREVAPALGNTLRTTPAREEPAHTITLAAGRLADTLARVYTRGGSVTVPAREVAGVLGAAAGNSVGRVSTLLLILLALDLG
jgi:hypothetical protein